MSNILITGSSSGFGALATEVLLQRGHAVFATMREPEGRNKEHADALRRMAAESDGTAHVLELDVCSDESVDRAVQSALEHGPIDVLINNAGIGAGGYAEAFSTEQTRQMFDVNVIGVQRVSRAVLPGMRERGQGLLLFVSSIMGRIVLPYAGIYTASKFAVEGLAESYAYELKGTGVDVSIVQPGGFSTGFGDRMLNASDTQRTKSYGEAASAPDDFWQGVIASLDNPDSPDPRLVADAIADLIAQPQGARPMRTVVAPGMEEMVDPLNDLSSRTQQALLSAMGLGHMLPEERLT